MADLRVACAQTVPAASDVTANVTQHLELAQAAASEVLVHTKRLLGSFTEEARVDGELPPPEPGIFTAGDLAPLVALSRGTAVVAICAEGNRAEHARAAAERGATTYLTGAFVIPSEYAAATANLRQRALDHGMLVAFANFGGSSGGLRSAGGSAIWSPEGRKLGELPSRGAGVLVAVGRNDGWTSIRP